jgi:hypothetical protein
MGFSTVRFNIPVNPASGIIAITGLQSASIPAIVPKYDRDIIINIISTYFSIGFALEDRSSLIL